MEGCIDVTHGHMVSGERLTSLSLAEKRPRLVSGSLQLLAEWF